VRRIGRRQFLLGASGAVLATTRAFGQTRPRRLAWLGAGLIRAFLYRTEPFDLLTISTVVVLMFGLTMAVTLRPALGAARVDLARVLREQ